MRPPVSASMNSCRDVPSPVSTIHPFSGFNVFGSTVQPPAVVPCPGRAQCSERLSVLPSGSLNQATLVPPGAVQMPRSSCSIPT